MSSAGETDGYDESGESVIDPQEFAAPVVRVHEEDARPRLAVAVTVIKQQVEAKAFGSPSDARRLGAAAVDEHDDALRQLADS